ncbi:MAG: SUMF1/EgtB/PvdO family nonheme iron enzyme [Planctomycetes bacterium]|nr:SUMF1/EgtB/PvdO family nonheme iron enzyme [Planctomycetota bacterium]
MKNNVDTFRNDQSTYSSLANMAIEKIIIDDYVLLEKIGQGGMGIVFKAKKKQTEEIVAIKFLLHYDYKCKKKATKIRLQRFLKEAEIGQYLHHPNIVHVHKLGYYNNSPYIVMDYIEGITLLKYIQQPHIVEQWNIYGNIFYQLTDALHYIHKNNILHRDIKPENILINQQGNPILMDFGIARNPLKYSSLTNTNILLGTPLYMSPEQADGKKVTGQSDIYQLGAVFYHALTNIPPYYGQTAYEILLNIVQGKAKPPQAFNPNIPIELENIVLKAIQRNISRRYKTAQEMAQDLKKYLDIYNLSEQNSELLHDTNNIEFKKSINQKRRKTKKYLKKNRSYQNKILTKKILAYTLFALFFFILYFIFDSNKTHNIIATNTDQSINNESTNIAKIKTIQTDKTSTNTPEITTQIENTFTDNLKTKKIPTNQPKTNPTPMDPYMEELFQHLENNDQFQYLGTQTYTCGEHTNTMHEYKHIQTEMEFVLIPSGTYFNRFIRKDIFIRSFLIAKYECTQKIWNLIVPDLLKQYTTDYSEFTVAIGDEYPIVGQTYSDSYEFCKRTGLSLPSANQWEYAARAGSKYRYCYGHNENQLQYYAWYGLNSNNSIHKVGQHFPNAFGLYDIHGNVPEQCADEYKIGEQCANTYYIKSPSGIFSWFPRADVYDVQDIDPCSRIFSCNDIPTKLPDIPNTERHHVFKGGNFYSYFQEFPCEYGIVSDGEKSSNIIGVRFIYSIFDKGKPNISINTSEITTIEKTPTDNLTTKKTSANNQTPMDIYMEKLFQHLENNDQFQYLGTKTYTCGEHTNTMHEYKHIQTGMEFVLLPSGYYDASFCNQYISIRSFLIAKYECTQKIWNFIVPDLPKRYIIDYPELIIGDEYPIVGQTYADSYEFCKRTGLSLPSVNQWEYAAKAGSKYRYCYGHDENQLKNYAWYHQNSNNSTHPVGQRLPNAFGLYDIHGNVGEQCADEINIDDNPLLSIIPSWNDIPTNPPHVPNTKRCYIYQGGHFAETASAQTFPSTRVLLSKANRNVGVRFIYSIFHY